MLQRYFEEAKRIVSPLAISVTQLGWSIIVTREPVGDVWYHKGCDNTEFNLFKIS